MKPIDKLMERSKKCDGIVHINWDNKPITNADRIRAMTDEELADNFSLWCCRSKTDYSYCKSFGACDKCWLDWLKEEVESNDS